FEKGHFGRYGLLAIGFVIIVSLGRALGDYGITQMMGPFPQVERLMLTPIHIGSVLVISFLLLMASSPIRLLHNWHARQYKENQQQAAQLAAEVGILRTQLNPHFLFNVLNNLYGLALTGSDLTAPSILKLAGMMRYMLYETHGEWVPLSQELTYLQDYIELQRLKTEFEQQIEWEVSGPVHTWKVPPLLFLPLLENGFKHGNLDQKGVGWLRANVIAEGSALEFTVTNSYLPNRPKDKVGGIGLSNIRQRLELYFPDAHSFHLSSDETTYTAILTLQRPEVAAL
ncbi:MAG: sensor histidine kinase, partial [Bacteroidota bacterium]